VNECCPIIPGGRALLVPRLVWEPRLTAQTRAPGACVNLTPFPTGLVSFPGDGRSSITVIARGYGRRYNRGVLWRLRKNPRVGRDPWRRASDPESFIAHQ
ncbi:MAG: hypothetical protein ACRDQZ_09075, partial [Mycobacteriales bacterium]